MNTPASPIVAVTRASERDAILSLVAGTGFFRPDEVLIAQEVLDDALKGGAHNPYSSLTAALDGVPVGWICFGPTACTIGTYDIYWIAVSLAHHRMGIGRTLLQHAEDILVRNNGRIAVIETSNKALYQPTRQFYLRNGYLEEACLKDFYAPGDDKVVYIKRLKTR